MKNFTKTLFTSGKKINQNLTTLLFGSKHPKNFMFVFGLIMTFLVGNFSFAQNAIVGSGFSTGFGGGSCPTGNSNFKYLAAGAGTSYGVTTLANGTGNQFFRFGIDWSGTTSQLAIATGVDTAILPNVTYNLNTGCTTNGSQVINVPNIANNYVFKTANAGTNPTGTFVYFQVQGAVQSIATVASSPASNVPVNLPVNVNANLSGALATGQAAYLRYTTNGFSTSTVVQMTGSGTAYTAAIPGQASGTNVSYYTFTSGTANVASDGSNADLYTINLNNNSGPNYTYTVTATVANVWVTSTGGSGSNGAGYTTLGAAITAINGGAIHTGAINVAIVNNTTETAAIVLNSSGATASYTSIKIFPGSDSLTVSGPTVTGRGLLELNGADNVTIDGDNPATSGINRNLTFTNTAAATIAYNMVIRIASFATVITSSDNNTIKNCILNGSATARNASANTSTTGSENTTYGIYAGGGATPSTNTSAPSAITGTGTTAASGATYLNLLIDNNQVNQCGRAIMIQGAAASVGVGLVISNNLIGAATPGSTTTVYSYGISAQGSSNGVIKGNTLRSVESFLASSLRGIDVGSISSIVGDNFTIDSNRVFNMVNGNTGGYAVYGINNAGGAGNIIKNNFIYSLNTAQNNSNSGTTFGVRGIRVSANTNHKIYNNSVSLSGAMLGTVAADVSACLTIVGTGNTGIDVRNNIFSNTQTGLATSGIMCVQLPLGGTSAMNLNLNNNVYYTGSAANSYLLGTTTPTFYTVGNFSSSATTPATNSRAYTSTLSAAGTNDNAAYAFNTAAPFVSASDLHINTGTTPTILESTGVSVAVTGVNVDIDNQNRPGPTGSVNGGGTAPDLGADEFDGTLIAPPVITSLGATAGCQGTSLVVTGTNMSLVNAATIGGTTATITGTTATTVTLTIGAGTTGTVTVTSPQGSATSSASFTVKPAPTTTWVASTPAVCFNAAAQTTTLAYTATTVSPINYSITWSPTPSNSFATVTNQTFAGSAGGGSITVNIPVGTASGSYTGTIKTTNTDGCDSPTSTFTVLVNSIPTGVTATASATTLCAGSDLSLTSTVDYVSVAVPGINFYTATRSTGTTFSSIIPATQVTSWRNAAPTNTDDNMSNNQPVGFNFTYNGIAYSTFRVSTNGFITFDNVSAATGAGTGAYGYENNYTLAGSGLIIAPNWDDLQTAGNAGTAADLNNSINYLTTGSAGSRILTVEWKNMQDFNTASTASYNWQVKLYEATGRIEFVYGTMTQSVASSASTGISGPTVSATPTAAQLLSQTTANTGSFGFTNQNTLATVPATNTTLTFTPTYGTYSWTGPNAFASALPNPTITAATAAASGVYNLSITNPTTGCSAPSVSTATVTVNPTSVAGTASASQTICSSTSPTALTLAGNTGTIQWQSSTDNVTFSNISGETTATLTIGTLTANAYYRAVVTSGVCASATSNAVTITVTPNTFNDTTLSACDTYTWANNGMTYTASGTYTGTTTGCVTERLILTITPSSFNDTTVTACTSYTWANNSVTYTMSGTYSGSTTACVTERLVLTITPSVTPTFTQVAPICSGDMLAALPTTSTNGVAGTWAPVINNTATTTYTFTPSGCAASTTMTIAVGGTKTWNAGWTPAGAPTSIDAVLITGNYTASTDGGTINGCSMTVDNNAVVLIDNNANIILQGKLTVTSGSVTVNNNSNLLQTRSIANSGNITIKRNSNALLRLDYTQWSTPVTGSGTLLQFSPATTANRFYSYNSATNLYNAFASPSTTTFDVARGYHIRMPNNWVAAPLPAAKFTGIFTGVPNNGPQAITMSNTGATLGYNLVGNPYPSDMSMASFVAANTANITGTLYFWRKSNNPATASYSTWTSGTFNQGTATATDPNGVISVGQGFIVEAATGQTNLVFNNSMRVADNVDHFFRSATTTDYNRIWLNVTNATGGFSQSTVGYITGATNNSDSFDGLFFNDGDINLASLIGTEKYAIQGRQLPFDDNDVVPLSFKATTAGNYTFAIDHVDGLFSGSSDIYVRDNVAGTVNNLTTGAYNFAANAGVDNTRFELLYRNALSTNNSILSDNNVFVFKANNAININTGKIDMDNVKVFDIRGRLLVEKSKVNASTLAIDSSSFANQVLIVTITSTDGVKVSKKIVN